MSLPVRARGGVFGGGSPDLWQVSANGGAQPCWGSDGTELYYVDNTTLMAVPVSTEQGFTRGQPQRPFASTDLLSSTQSPGYDVSADGQRFVTVTPVEDGEETTVPRIRVVQNWYEEFRDREQ
jgi:hypothetical protein